MDKKFKEQLMLKTINLALKAGEEILNIYKSKQMNTVYKSNQTPLTEADLKSNSIIKEGLKETPFPIISEENTIPEYQERKKWEYFWLVDPLDGTKEFINNLTHFTVNIALIKKQTPEMGVVYVPAEKNLYFGDSELGAFKIVNTNVNYKNLQELSRNIQFLPVYFNQPLGVVASKSHLDSKTEEFINKLKQKHEDLVVHNLGSSVKFCILAEGLAHFYPRYSPTYEWDTAAGHAILKATGGSVMALDTKDELKYNKPDLLNPGFLAYRNG